MVRCAPWSWTLPAARCVLFLTRPSASPARARRSSLSTPAGVCRTDLHILGRRADRRAGIARPRPPGRRHGARDRPRRRLEPGRAGSACPGSGGRAASAGTAAAAARTCASRAVHRPRHRRRLRATRTVADTRYCFALPRATATSRPAPAPLRGLIGHRALRMCGDAERLGLYGFGASAHIVCQVALHQGRRAFAFTRAGRHGLAGVRALARLRVGGRRDGPGRRRSSTPRSSSRPSARSCRPRCARSRRAGRRLRRDPHERHPVVPVRDSVGERVDPLGREPHRATTRASCSTSPRACRCART
jgi:hypothetical protein